MFLELHRRFRHIAGPLFGLSLTAYFAYHTVEGDRGVLAYIKLKNEIQQAELYLSDITTQRQALEHRVLLLRPDHLDPDMLEERARIMLNMTYRDELVVVE